MKGSSTAVSGLNGGTSLVGNGIEKCYPHSDHDQWLTAALMGGFATHYCRDNGLLLGPRSGKELQ
ncbi:hypothetical protein AXF42_Ash012793 [Apostasia shenzhenica]|uniref:Uncharacterized protein n=1 Tax=Apostasia shenzhenica TaxID=1088818 RepID=A0A2I0AM85_9ASPA|nr:hypothetical protein AXF42_Ash012793 [Apostasia shenzhenica]